MIINLKRLLWKLKFTYYFCKATSWNNIRWGYDTARGSLKEIDYDLTEDPKYCVEEEFSCWSE